LAGQIGPGWPLAANVFLLGAANGAFSIAAIGSMMRLAAVGRQRREGVRMGLWGASQAIAFALGGVLGTAAVDLAKLVVTDAIQLALYDPMVVEDPQLDPANAGTSTEDELLAIQEGIADAAPVEVLMTFPQNGYLFVTVIYDDGTVQAWADATYGAGVVAVRSALVSLSAG
jgi:hypothetical protein